MQIFRHCAVGRAGAVVVAALVLCTLPARLCAQDADANRQEAARQAAVMALVSESPATTHVEVQEWSWVDEARDRTVPVRLYWPAVAEQGAPVPLIVFSHGLGGSRAGYSHLGRFWASQGYASLHLQHAGSDRSVWAGNPFTVMNALRAAAAEPNAVARAQDVSFAITQILAHPRFGQHLDASHIAVAGHSYGANTALLVAGAKVERDIQGERKVLNFRDPRVSAALIISAPPFYADKDWRTVLAGIEIPTMHITGTEDTIRVPGYGSAPEDRLKVFEAMPTGERAPPKALAVYRGATHSIFTDRIDQSGPQLNDVVKAGTRELSAAFWAVTLAGGPWSRLREALAAQAALLSRQEMRINP